MLLKGEINLSENRDIRFITPDYKELFRIQDGGSIVLTFASGSEYVGECKYLDQTHFELKGTCWHICQYAGFIERNGATVRSETEPEVNNGYRIMQRMPVGCKVFKLGHNPNAVQEYVTWQGYSDNPDQYDWGHYWSSMTTAETDLLRRADAERTGIPYDYTKLIKQAKTRDYAR